MRRLVSHMRAANPSFGQPICAIPTTASQRTPEFGMWINLCFVKKMISPQSYESYWCDLMKLYDEIPKEDKGKWADVFEYVLKK